MTLYRTAAGSLVEISGTHNGISTITFDWFEEGACRDALPIAEIAGEARLTWSCQCCGSGSAALVCVQREAA